MKPFNILRMRNASAAGGGSFPASLKLLANMEGADNGTTFTDSSPSARTISRVESGGTVRTSTARFKEGAASALYSGTATLETADSEDFNFGTGAFTVGLWAYKTSGNGFLIGQRSGDPHWSLVIITTGVELHFHTTGTDVGILGGQNRSNLWQYFTITRNASGVIRLRQDGRIIGTTTNAAAMDAISAALRMGGRFQGDDGSYQFNGNIDAAFIIKGEDIFDSDAPIYLNNTLTVAPQFFVAPKITTSGFRSTGDTLTCAPGIAWPYGTSYAYQWKRNGSPIGGETASTYVLQGADAGAEISCTVTASGANGSVSATAVLGYRRWRVNVTAINGGAAVGINEISMHRAADISTEIGSGTPSASSQWSTNEQPAEAFNHIYGVAGDAWASVNGGALPQWIEYDYGAGQMPDIRRVAITARGTVDASQAPKDFAIQYYDGSTWQTAWSVTNQTGWGNYETRTFDKP